MRTIDADALMPLFMKKACTMKDRHGIKLGEEWLLNYNDIKDVIDNAPTIDDLSEYSDKLWQKAYERGKAERPQGEPVIKCKDCKYQVKEWQEDRRIKEKGYWVYGCKHFGELMGYWGFGGNDNEFCSDAEIKESENE